MPFNVRENVGPYRVIEQLGQEGMPTVFQITFETLSARRCTKLQKDPKRTQPFRSSHRHVMHFIRAN